MIRKGFSNEVEFEPRSKGSAGVNLVEKWRESILERNAGTKVLMQDAS